MANLLLVDDKHVQHGVAVGVLLVGVGAARQDQPVALLLAEAGREAERILAPVHVAIHGIIMIYV